MRGPIIIVIAVFLAGSSPVLAAEEALASTRDLYRECKRSDQGLLFCAGYFRGFYHMSLVHLAHMNGVSKTVVDADQLDALKLYVQNNALCINSKTVTGIDELIRVFINWAARNPNKWHETMGLGVYRALKEAYPCK